MDRATFIMSTEAVNRYGFRILSGGIDTADFMKNPVAFYNHLRKDDNWAAGEYLPIGRWENLRIDDQGRLLGDVVFDMEDEYAAKIAGKVDRGFLNACSVAVDPVELSDDPEDVLPGQDRMTVTRSKLLECSIVDLPGQAGAVRLRGEKARENDFNIPTIQLRNQTPNMELVNIKLGLDKSASADDVLAKVDELQTQLRQAQDKAQRVDELEQRLAAAEQKAQQERVEALIGGAKAANKITEAEENEWKALAESNFEATKKLLDKRKPIESISQKLSAGRQDSQLEGSWDELHKSGKLAQLKESNPDRYKQLYQDRFGKLPS